MSKCRLIRRRILRHQPEPQMDGRECVVICLLPASSFSRAEESSSIREQTRVHASISILLTPSSTVASSPARVEAGTKSATQRASWLCSVLCCLTSCTLPMLATVECAAPQNVFPQHCLSRSVVVGRFDSCAFRMSLTTFRHGIAFLAMEMWTIAIHKEWKRKQVSTPPF